MQLSSVLNVELHTDVFTSETPRLSCDPQRDYNTNSRMMPCPTLMTSHDCHMSTM